MRICLYTDTALPKMGGQEMVVDTLARQFQALGQDVIVLAPHPRLPLLARKRDRQLPYPVVRHPRFYSTRFLVDWYRFFLLRLYRRFPFDVLHCHGIYPPGYLAAQCRPWLPVPVLITSHGGDIRPEGIRQSKPVVRRRQVVSVRGADRLVAISQFTGQGFCHWGADAGQIVAIPNGVDVEAYARPTARPADLDSAIEPGGYALFLGRLVHRKGMDLALQALLKLPPNGKVQLVIAGGGDELAALRQMTTQLQIQERVRLVGPTFGDAKIYLLQNALFTVIPSRISDAFPLVLLESFAAGTPVLGTRVPGLQDLVEVGKSGWLVAPESPDSLAEVFNLNFHDPESCRALGRQAKKLAEAFSWRGVAQQHLELYEKLLRHRQIAHAV